jgi:serine/threonine-protein phosphatase 2A activator
MPCTSIQTPVPDAAKDAIISKLRRPANSDSSPQSSTSAPAPSSTPSEEQSQATAENIETVSIQEHIFQEPRKRIVSPASLHRFEHSDTFAEILSFIHVCNTSVVGKTLTDNIETSPTCKSILAIMDEVAAIRKATPPDASIGSSRFGNPAFRTFYAKIRDNNDRLHRMIPGLGDDSEASQTARAELGVYLQESWGNEKRIDYGSGMELNMACWL